MAVEISSDAVSVYLQRIRVNFPTFRAFGSGDQGVDATERDYKMELVRLFQEELAGSLSQFPDEPAEQRRLGLKLGEFFKRRLSDGQSQILVNWRYWTALTRLDGDGQSKLAAAVSALLYGRDPIETRVDAFVPLLQDLLARGGDNLEAWPAKSRILPTFLLMLSDHWRYCIVKTEEFRRAVEALARDKLPAQAMTGEDYRRLLEFLAALKATLVNHGLRPRDMIDVQTFIWIGDEKYQLDSEETKNGRAKSPSEVAAAALVEDLAELESEVPDITERDQLTKARVGQGRFRADVTARWGRGEACALTGIAIDEMLVASHIKPWRDSSNSERMDPMNGLLLVAHADRLFDRHLMSFKKVGGDYVSVVHPRLRLDAKRAGIAEGVKLQITQLRLSEERRFEQYMSEHFGKHLELVESDKAKGR
ncbi:HNH endonuclease [Paraburkholderia gardini]|uniref:HNH endonuclease n=1 Tax=Paraburkholderia gardini TaxID=2823469 RepID=UPI001D7BF606|nr:HNH endonuclease signature motif containing protein [Paraburkholderia gardini]CAG4901537.1 hypothetical protein R69919_02850 [Paraburkholderia gardini]